jgi:hypothetical protein
VADDPDASGVVAGEVQLAGARGPGGGVALAVDREPPAPELELISALAAAIVGQELGI